MNTFVLPLIFLMGVLLALWVRRLQTRMEYLESKYRLLSRILAGENEAQNKPKGELTPPIVAPISVAARGMATFPNVADNKSDDDKPAAGQAVSIKPKTEFPKRDDSRRIAKQAKALPLAATCLNTSTGILPGDSATSVTSATVASPRSSTELGRPSFRPQPQRTEISSSNFLNKAEWEAVVGGSWLNKIGVLLILVGLTIFLGYSLTQLGPAGRVVTGFAVSAVMLAVGMALQNRPLYRVFAKGFVAGGWSAAYFTTYAMHALEPARIIENTILATTLLFLVPLAMLLHAFWQKSEAGSTLAFLYGTLTIVLSPPYLFAGVALLPLLIGLLAVAYRFDWERTGVIAVVSIYAAFTWKFADGVPAVLPFAVPWLMFACWFIFESFDIIVVSFRRPHGGSGRALFPLNTCGLLAALHLTWPANDSFELAYAIGAGLYLLSAVVRAWSRPPEGIKERNDPLWHGLLGGYELAATAAACLTAAALTTRFTGLRLTTALFFEYQLIFLIGLGLSQKYLRALASLFSIVVVGRLCWHVGDLESELQVVGLTLNAVTPLALIVSIVMYFNRSVIRLDWNEVWLRLEPTYAFAATTLLVVVFWLELPLNSVGTCTLILAFVLLQVGFLYRLWDIQAQACASAFFGFACALAVNGLLLYETEEVASSSFADWIWLAPSTVIFGVAAAEVLRWRFGLTVAQRTAVEHGALAGGLTLLGFLSWHALPAPVVAVSWAAVALCLYESGFQLRLPILRSYGSVMAVLAFGRLFLANFINTGTSFGVSHRLLSVLPMVLMFYFLSHRAQQATQQPNSGVWEQGWSRVSLYLGSILGVLLIRFEMGRVLAVIGWTAAMLTLYSIGVWRQNRDLRWQSYLLGLLTLSRCWATNFFIPESLAGAFGRMATGSLVAAGFFAALLLSKLSGRAGSLKPTERKFSLANIDQHAGTFFSISGGFLVALLIFYEVSGRVLTVAWATEAATLLIIGLVLRDQVLRLFSLGLFGICIVKAFVYDMGALSTPYRILSFVLLGILLVCVSWIYTRFRGRVTSHPAA